MNNYEKRVFVNYFSKLMNNLDFECYGFGDVLDFFLDEFKVDRKRFKLSRNGYIQLENRNQVLQCKKILQELFVELKNEIKPRNTVLEKKLKIVKEIYCLTKDEISILEFYILQEVNNIFREFFRCIKGEDYLTFTKAVYGIRQGKTNRILNELYHKNLLSAGHRGNYDLSPEITKIFDSQECNTIEKISKALLGEQEKTDLTSLDFIHIEPKQKKVVKLLKNAVRKRIKGVNILLYGNVGVGKTEFAKLVANLASLPLYAVKSEKEDFEEPTREDRLIDLCSKQYILSKIKKSCILFDEAEDVMNRGFSGFGSASKGYLNKILESTPVPVIWTTNNIYDVDPAFLRRMTYAVEFEKLSEETRLNIWENVLKKNKFEIKQSKLEELNKSYDIPPSLIANAVQSTKMIDGDENDFEDFIENVAQIVTKKKNIKIKKVFESKDYDINLVNTDIDMNDLTNKITKSKNLNFSLCLYGEPGTGKSYYAKYLADTLGIEVVYKKASDLISPYIGETEQNIAKAFNEAKSKQAMLIFDEADSFLQNRNNAIRSWEISQVNEMLTQMENAEYPFVCTTNLLDSLDEASLRRFTFKIKFDFLKKEQVPLAIEHFFNIKISNINIKGLTAGDFATVKKKVKFLGVETLEEITKMLNDEVKVKKSSNLKNSIGF